MSLVTFANPLQGSTSQFDFSAGNMYPAIARPFGMNFWSPQTSEERWFYKQSEHRLQGIRCTHQASPWMGDYGHFTIMPLTGRLMTGAVKRSSGFRRSEEVAYPHYYSAYLQRYNTRVEVTPTERCAVMRFTFPTTDDACILVETFAGATSIEIDAVNRRIIGKTDATTRGVLENFACYFVAEVDTAIREFGVFEGDTVETGAAHFDGKRAGGFVRFAAQAGQPITLKVATSFISAEQALISLHREVGAKSFDDVKAEAEQSWNTLLSRIEIETDDEAQKRTFYSAFYRTLLFPRMFYEYDGNGEAQHYSPFDGKLHAGVLYTDNGFWDTYRTMYPFLALIFPERLSEILNGWLNAYREGGWLPKWATPGYRNCMIGTHSDSIFAEACLKEIPDVAWHLAYDAVKKNATVTGIEVGEYGRRGLADFIERGYIPLEHEEHATCATLDYAYSDFCLSKMAEKLGYSEDVAIFAQRGQNYRNVFDVTTNFMRGRHADGSWETPFNPLVWGGGFIEGGAWQHVFAVPHDVEGLIELMGGREKFVAKLDEMMTTVPDFEIGTYPYEIHEMTEMAAVDFGQYAHSNQPVHHVLYFYAHAGAPEKTRHYVRRVLTELYTPDTLCGDEDNGEMSAWYIFSSLGFYPTCPTKLSYTVGCLLFKRALLHLSNGRTLEILPIEEGERPLEVMHARLLEGGTLRL